MAKKHFVIYLPGLADHRAWNQPRVIARWTKAGLVPVYHKIGWASNESFETKFKRVLEHIEELHKEGQVSLIGISAGASMALNAFKARPKTVHSIVLISGKLHSPWTVNPSYYQKNPALKASFELAHRNYHDLSDEQKSRILTIHGIRDGIVPPAASIIPGVKNKVVPAIGHIPSIFVALVFYSGLIAKFFKE